MNSTLLQRLGVALPFALPGAAAAQEVLEEVHVTGAVIPTSPTELAQSVSVIRGETLDRITDTSIGETLANQLGVSSSQFGAGASRPIIRGLAGARVRTLEDGIDSLDVSTVSGDHAVSVDPLVAEQIEIFRGPTTLLYGSGAVGGVVNTVTNRIPEHAPEAGLEGAFELRGNTVADERTGALALDGGGDRFAWHLDAASRDADDYEIPGPAEHDGEDHEPGANGLPEPTAGTLENSELEIDTGALGASWLGESGFFGASVSTYRSVYGVPGHAHDDEEEHEDEEEHDEEEDHAEEQVLIDLEQTRLDLKGGWLDVSEGIAAINFRAGINDYEHVELEGGEAATRFSNEAYEARLEVMHSPWGRWNGAFGLQLSDRQFAAFGEEAFVPPVDTRSYGVFAIEQLDAEYWQFSLGARLERQRHEPSSGLAVVEDTARSLSFAALRPVGSALTLAINAALAERLPVAEELYADGPHLATGSVEVGNPALGAETSRHVDLGIRKTDGELTWSVTGFLTRYEDFIYLRATGLEDPVEELPIFVFDQRDARLRGVEAELFTPIGEAGPGELDLRVFADYVEGELDNGDDLPRLPPLRYGARLQYHDERFIAGIEATRYDEQSRTAPFEEPTAGYTMINADFNWRLGTAGGTQLDVFLRGTNLADEEARKHTSFVKEVAPLPGRNLTIGIRTRF